ncbi:Zn-ribbon domain-containing OB-fold protein, partial [Natronoarchaeum mannanilyticum]
ECPGCGALNFPPSGACRRCNATADAYDPVPLPGTGTVEAVTTIAQGGAPPEFVEQQSKSGPFVSAVVALDGPRGEETVSIPTQVLASDDEVEIGTRVETTIRRIYTQEDVIRYGFKARVASDVR